MIVKMENVTKKFKDVVAIKHISLQINKGELLTIIGPNGAGKSTLEKILVGLYEPNEGFIEVFGKDLADIKKEARRKISYVGENYSLYDNLSVKSNLEFFAKLYSIDKEEAAKRAQALLKKFDASEYFNRKVGELSRGTKQKIAICRALITDPELLVLDEPTAFLDPNSAELLRQEMLNKIDEGKTLIYATQRLDELSRLGSHVLLLSKGRIAAEGSFEEVTKAIKGISIEVILLNPPTSSQKGMLRRMGAAARGNRLVFKVKQLSDMPKITKELVGIGLEVLTINYLNYNMNDSGG